MDLSSKYLRILASNFQQSLTAELGATNRKNRSDRRAVNGILDAPI